MDPLKIINSPKEQLFAPTLLIFMLITIGQVAILSQNLKNSADYYSQWLVASSVAFILCTFVLTYYNIFIAWQKKRGFLIAINVILASGQLWLCLANVDFLTNDSFPVNSFAYLLGASAAFNLQLFLGNHKDLLKYGVASSLAWTVILGILFQKYLTQVQFLQIISFLPLLAYTGFFLYLVRRMVRI
jgi:hypothetical protein